MAFYQTQEGFFVFSYRGMEGSKCSLTSQLSALQGKAERGMLSFMLVIANNNDNRSQKDVN